MSCPLFNLKSGHLPQVQRLNLQLTFHDPVLRVRICPLTVQVVLIMAVVLFASGVYYCENPDQEQELSEFNSIALSMYWASITITTVGYGDMVPQSACGQMMAIFASIVRPLSLPPAVAPRPLFSILPPALYNLALSRCIQPSRGATGEMGGVQLMHDGWSALA
jgi:hypothetical protein